MYLTNLFVAENQLRTNENNKTNQMIEPSFHYAHVPEMDDTLSIKIEKRLLNQEEVIVLPVQMAFHQPYLKLTQSIGLIA